LVLSGCVGAAHNANRGDLYEPSPIGSAFEDEPFTESSEAVSDSAALTSVDSQTAAVNPEEVMVEAEALYSTGVAANLDQRWQDAQVAFERAASILDDIDLGALSDAESAAKIDKLLSEIAADYQKTLQAIGELDENATSSAVLLRFESADSTLRQAPSAAPIEKPPVQYDVPIELNDKVRNCILFYQTVAREPFERFLGRAGRYLPMMKEIFASYGLPGDLAYLPFVESGFNNNAYSYAHAAGPWQFIASTGRRYGLTRNVWWDERRDFEKSTHAACRYLADLYGMFNAWPLALAAYNGGEGRVGRQIKRQHTNDFWKLKLRDQTRNYVPLFMAALMIAKDPESYGFYIEPDPPLEFDWVATNKPLELKDVAAALGTSESVLVDLNPELRRGVTPPDVTPYRVRVPKGTAEQFAAIYRTLPASSKTQLVEHTVRRGETLGAIARRYGVATSEILAQNQLSPKKRLKVGQVLTIPAPGHLAERDVPDPSPAPKAAPARGDDQYVVREGDTLWELAKKFGTTTSAIRAANRMGAHDKLSIGQVLVLPDGSGSSAKKPGGFWYTVRQGDTVLRIATRFGLSIAQLLAHNSLGDPDQIRVGQRIHIPADL
jgi:membrane-bound lytic murein transglycosylase D